jgi:acyl-CoA thioester hydrolase
MPKTRELYPCALTLATRWMDNDVVYFSYFDPVVNEYLIRAAVRRPCPKR